MNRRFFISFALFLLLLPQYSVGADEEKTLKTFPEPPTPRRYKISDLEDAKAEIYRDKEPWILKAGKWLGAVGTVGLIFLTPNSYFHVSHHSKDSHTGFGFHHTQKPPQQN